MAVRRRVRYSPEFRAEAVRRARHSDESVAAIARDLGISPASLQTWVNAARPPADVLVTEDERTELRRLRKENRELRTERDILKKAAAFFASEIKE